MNDLLPIDFERTKINSSYMRSLITNSFHTFVEKNIYINQMRSPLIRERIYKGRCEIKKIRTTLPEARYWKMYVNDKCELMVKKAEGQRYMVHMKF